jgi:hypothetical protein
MAIKTKTRDPRLSRLSVPSIPVRRATQKPLRVVLVVLSAIVALTALQGAIFVLPNMPTSVLRQGMIAPFSDYTIPALALGVLCGGGALAALIAILLLPWLGGLLSVVAGAFMVGFELVEIAAVGFTPVQTPAQPQAWLQVFYLVVGSVMAALGWRLWRTERAEMRAFT